MPQAKAAAALVRDRANMAKTLRANDAVLAEALERLDEEEARIAEMRAELGALGCESTANVRDLDTRLVRKAMTVVGERLVQELRGVACLDREEIAATRKGCAVTRSFSERVEDLATMEQAFAAHASHLGEKLRREGLGTDYVTAFFISAASMASGCAAVHRRRRLGHAERPAPHFQGRSLAIGDDGGLAPQRRVAGARTVPRRVVAGVVMHAGGIEVVGRRQALAALTLAAVVSVEHLLAGDDPGEVALRRRGRLGTAAGVEFVCRTSRPGPRGA